MILQPRRAAISNNGRKKFSREQPCSPEQRVLTGLSPIHVQAIQIRAAGQCATSPIAPWSPDYVTHRFKYFIRKLELPDRYSLHSARHTFTTELRKKGVSIETIFKLLGHSSPSVTQRHYDHSKATHFRDEVNLLDFSSDLDSQES